MEEQEQWVFFKDIDWDCPKNNKFNVDTRDFHCGYHFTDIAHKDFEILKKYDKFFFTKEEMKSEIERLFNESGGVGKWRLLSLQSKDERVLYWNIKYLRIWRTEKGFLICNSYEVAIPKDILACDVNKELLH